MIQRSLFVILLVLCQFDLTLAGDWPQWRGPDRTDVSKETGLLQSWPLGGPKLLWIFFDAGVGYSCLSVVGDRLYSMGAEGKRDASGKEKEYVYAIDLKTQKKLWSVEVGPRYVEGAGDGPRSTPTIDGNLLYTIGAYGNLVCVETTRGRKVWSQDLVKNLGGLWEGCGAYTESPLVDGDRVVVTPGCAKGAIAAFDKKSGTLKWRSTALTGRASYSSIIAAEIEGVRQYIQLTGDCLVGVRASDGKLLWRFPFTAISTPICRNDYVYVSSIDSGCGRLLKIVPEGDEFTVKPIHANREMQNGYGGVILVGEYLYGYSDKGGWICQDFKTGKTIWKNNPRMGRGSVTFADGNLYGYHEDRGDVLLIKATPEGYKEQGKFRIPEESKLRRKNKDARIYTHPVVANGKLYLRDQELIFCYDVRKPKEIRLAPPLIQRCRKNTVINESQRTQRKNTEKANKDIKYRETEGGLRYDSSSLCIFALCPLCLGGSFIFDFLDKL